VLQGTELLEIAGRGGRRWMVAIPDDAEDGYEIRIRWDGLAYEGELRDFVTDEPLARVRIFAKPEGASRSQHGTSTVSDSEGRFRLEGLESDTQYQLAFNHSSSAPYREHGSSHLSRAFFVPENPPSVSPAPFLLRLPSYRNGTYSALEEVEITGTVTDSEMGLPVAEAVVSARSVFPQEGGRLELMRITNAETDEHGRFSCRAARAPHYEATVGVYDPLWTGYHFEWAGIPGESRITRDFAIPLK